jgi:hypothetical protein
MRSWRNQVDALARGASAARRSRFESGRAHGPARTKRRSAARADSPGCESRPRWETCPWVRDREPPVRAPAGFNTWQGLQPDPGSSNGRTRSFGLRRCGFESSSRNHAFRIGVRQPLVWVVRPGRHRGKAPFGCSSAGRARRSHRRGRGFEARRPLHVTVVSAVSTQPCHGCRAGSNPVGHSQAELAQFGKRRPVQGGKVRGSNPRFGTEGEPGRRLGSPAKRCAATVVSFDYCAFCSWRMNQPGGWPRPETGRRVTPWDSISPSSAISRLFASGGRVVMESDPAGGGGRFEGGSAFALGIVPSALRNGRCAAGAAAGPEPSRRVTPWGSTPPSSSQWPRPIRS